MIDWFMLVVDNKKFLVKWWLINEEKPWGKRQYWTRGLWELTPFPLLWLQDTMVIYSVAQNLSSRLKIFFLTFQCFSEFLLGRVGEIFLNGSVFAWNIWGQFLASIWLKVTTEIFWCDLKSSQLDRFYKCNF